MLLADLAGSLLGPVWVSQLARLTGHPSRTVQRIRDYAREGREHPKAQAVADAFAAAIAEAQARADALATVRETKPKRRKARAGPARRLGDAERAAFVAARPDLRR